MFWEALGTVAFTAIICGALAGLFIGGIAVNMIAIKKATGKRILKILMGILIIIIIIAARDEFGFWNLFWSSLIAYYPAYYVGYIVLKHISHVCPHCGEWNCQSIAKVLNENTYEKRVNVKHDVRNKSGKVIGSYDTSEIHSFLEREMILKCNACGKEYEWRETRDLDR